MLVSTQENKYLLSEETSILFLVGKNATYLHTPFHFFLLYNLHTLSKTSPLSLQLLHLFLLPSFFLFSLSFSSLDSFSSFFLVEGMSLFFSSLFWRLEIWHWKHIIKHKGLYKQSSDIFGYYHGMGILGHLSYDLRISIEHIGPSNCLP